MIWLAPGVVDRLSAMRGPEIRGLETGSHAVAIVDGFVDRTENVSLNL